MGIGSHIYIRSFILSKSKDFVFGMPSKAYAEKLRQRFPDGLPKIKGVQLRGVKQVAK